MCGIVAYIGPKEAYPVILKGLKRLEYRGYDSSGVALLNSGLKVYKKKGKVADLEESLMGKDLHANAGIGHTRWATHGEPSDRNAHPHTFVISDTLDRAVPPYPRLGEIVVDVDGSLLRRWITLLHVVARDRQGGPRGGVFGQPEVRRFVVGVVRHGTGGRLLGRVLVAITDLGYALARAVSAELAASETEK